MKQLDKLLIRSFIGPFIITFGIAIFVLLMQILWLYLDEIAGKGLGFFLIVELMAYKCVGLIPLALPLALLISSVMVLGSLAEHYELSSFKSAGVSLLRVMLPVILFGALGTVGSYLCSDYLIPVSNVQFGARMYDIQQKKPTLSLEAGSFNEDFNQFAIHIGSKETNGRDIHDVLIYDHSKASIGQLSHIAAKDGEMYPTEDGNYFIMQLYNGNQYAESGPGKQQENSGSSFVRTAFNSYTKLFDLTQFDLEKTQTNLFQQNRAMLATWQLQIAIDSIDLDILERKQVMSNHLTNYLTELPRDTIKYRPDREKKAVEAAAAEAPRDTITTADGNAPGQLRRNREQKAQVEKQASRYDPQARRHPLVKATQNWDGIEAIVQAQDEITRIRIKNRARSAARSILTQAESGVRILPGVQETRVKHVYDMHMKYSMALVCIIFVFIGAPMGAIVRKGGFGVPILVSIIFFVIFIILTIFCRKLAESFVVSGALAGWMPCIILFPVGLFLTVMAMNDRKLVNTDSIRQAFSKLKLLVKKTHANATSQLK